jgi:hypothetical protein
MVEYECPKCNKKFNHKGNYEKHMNKSNTCILPTSIILNDDHICLYCNNQFTRNYDLKRHQLTSCKDKRIYELEKKMLDQQKLIDTIVKMQPLNDNHSINQSLNNNNNSFNITINVSAYGKEDLSHITDDDYKKIFRLCNSSVPEFIKLKHFDKKHPENSNVYIPNMTGTHGYMYDGEQWNAIDKHKLITCLYDDNCDLLIDKYNIMKEQYKNGTLGKFDKFIDKHENDEVIKDTTRMIELIAYNYKEMAKQNKKKSEKMNQ